MVANRTRRTPSRAFVSQSFTVRQQSVGAYNDNGIFVKGGETDTVLTGSVQPADGETVQQLDITERQLDALSIWSNGIDGSGNLIKIKSVRFGNVQSQGDKIIFDGFEWNVRRVKDFNIHGHQEILAVKVDGQNG